MIHILIPCGVHNWARSEKGVDKLGIQTPNQSTVVVTLKSDFHFQTTLFKKNTILSRDGYFEICGLFFANFEFLITGAVIRYRALRIFRKRGVYKVNFQKNKVQRLKMGCTS